MADVSDAELALFPSRAGCYVLNVEGKLKLGESKKSVAERSRVQTSDERIMIACAPDWLLHVKGAEPDPCLERVWIMCAVEARLTLARGVGWGWPRRRTAMAGPFTARTRGRAVRAPHTHPNPRTPPSWPPMDGGKDRLTMSTLANAPHGSLTPHCQHRATHRATPRRPGPRRPPPVAPLTWMLRRGSNATHPLLASHPLPLSCSPPLLPSSPHPTPTIRKTT